VSSWRNVTDQPWVVHPRTETRRDPGYHKITPDAEVRSKPNQKGTTMKTLKIAILGAALLSSSGVFAAAAPEGNGNTNTASYAAPEGSGNTNTASYAAPEGNGSINTASYAAPEGNGSVNTASYAAPEGNDSVNTASIEPEGHSQA
jgi:hypothetical protein